MSFIKSPLPEGKHQYRWAIQSYFTAYRSQKMRCEPPTTYSHGTPNPGPMNFVHTDDRHAKLTKNLPLQK
jgi:hypothetical protein